MATIRDYFDTDFPFHWRCLGTGVSKEGEPDVSVRVHVDLDAATKFVSVFIPRTADTLDYCRRVMSVLPEVFKMKYLSGIQIPSDDPSHIGFKANFGVNDTKALTFSYTMHDLYNLTVTDEALHDSKFIFLYVDYEFSFEEWKELQIAAVRYGYYVRLRDLSYARQRLESDRPAAFISYDHRDKDQVARPLAVALRQRKLSVWFDEFALKPGDRIRMSLDEGLKRCKKCIAILSPSYLSNKSWANYELNTIITREVQMGGHVLVPVWIGVTKQDIYDFNPQLLDVLAVVWEKNEQDVADRLMKALL